MAVSHMPLGAERTTNDALRDIAKRRAARGQSAKTLVYRSRFDVHNPEPERWTMCWVEPDRAETIFERGGELVPVTPGTMEEYHLGQREVEKVDGSAEVFTRSGMWLGRIPTEIVEDETDAIVLGAYADLGSDMRKVTRDAQIASESADVGHPGQTNRVFAQLETEEKQLAAAAKTALKQKPVKGVNDALARQGMTRAMATAGVD